MVLVDTNGKIVFKGNPYLRKNLEDDIDKLLFKLKVNQEILAKLLLKPLDRTTQLAIKTRAVFGETLYHRIGDLIKPPTEQSSWRDRQERERIVRFSMPPKSIRKE